MASEHGIISTDPVQAWEYAALLGHLGEPWLSFYQLLWNTGLRVSEALSVRREDVTVELLQAHLTVVRLKQKAKRVSTLPVPMWLAAQMQALPKTPRQTYVFGHRSQAYSRQTAFLILQRACREAGLRQLHPHQFRHSVGFRLAAADFGLSAEGQRQAVAAALGHANTKHVDRYSRPPGDFLDKLFEKIQQ